MKLGVSEIYASIQGESSHAGRPCTFVRLAGCPLRCRWCDTVYSFDAGEMMTIEAIVAKVAALGLPLVELTGGEPLAQRPAPALVEALCQAGHEVLIETSGAYPVSGIDARAKIIADLKCPGSNEAARNRMDVLAALRSVDELKIVVADRADFDWARSQLDGPLATTEATILWSAVHGELQPATLAAWLLAERPRGRMQLQLHKILWPEIDRGV
ncbi:MAG: radical SAM protein [Deltaproteobacteria bacterium]|nr:radical SAM protein [Deltaproteobacteria bacterium]